MFRRRQNPKELVHEAEKLGFLLSSLVRVSFVASLEGAETPMDSKCLPRTLFEKAPVTLWAKQKTPGDQQVWHGGQVPGGWTPVLFTHRLVPWK